MQSCPPEILHRIFALACVDYGKTGTSLALVSKYIHEASDPYQMQTVEVTSLKRARALLRRLEKASPAARMVRDLRFSNYGHGWGKLQTFDNEGQTTSSSGRNVLRAISTVVPGVKRRRDRREAEEKRLLSQKADMERMDETLCIFAKTLEHISLTLRTLTIGIIFPENLGPEAVSTMNLRHDLVLPPLPALTSLTFKDRYILYLNIFSYSNPANYINPTSLPRLKYLDLVGLMLLPGMSSMRSAVDTLGASLTHLRFPGSWIFGLEMFDLHPDREGNILPTITRCYMQECSMPPPLWACGMGGPLPPDERLDGMRALSRRLHFLRYKESEMDIRDLEEDRRKMFSTR